jgi:hypothetical protein
VRLSFSRLKSRIRKSIFKFDTFRFSPQSEHLVLVFVCLTAFEADIEVDAFFAQKVTNISLVVLLTIAASEVNGFV